MNDVKMRRAEASDADAIAECVRRAYAKHSGRLALPPKPVLADYGAVVRETMTWVLVDPSQAVVGVLVLIDKPEHLLLDNVALDPDWQGRGLGRRLLSFAEDEARRLSLNEIRLYTNALMTENRALYARVGYVEYERRDVNGRDTVFMRKRI